MTEPMTPREKARRLLAAEAFKGAIANRINELRADQTTDVLALYRDSGTSTISVDEGTISVIKPKPSISVTDEPGLLAYVQEHHPTEVVSVIRPAFRGALTGRLAIVAGEVVDTRTGEVVPWAKAFPAADPTSIQVKPNADAKQRAADLIAQRLPELTAGGDDAA